MSELIKDLSVLTQIGNKELSQLVTLSNWDICHCVFEQELNNEKITQIDIGIGTLYIEHNDDELSYKFIPSKCLEQNLIKTIQTQASPLIIKSQEKLKSTIMNAYKELL